MIRVVQNVIAECVYYVDHLRSAGPDLIASVRWCHTFSVQSNEPVVSKQAFKHLSKLSACWKWDFFADKCPNFSRRQHHKDVILVAECIDILLLVIPPLCWPAGERGHWRYSHLPLSGSCKPWSRVTFCVVVTCHEPWRRDAVMLWSWNLPSPSSFQCVHPRTAAAPVFSSTTSQGLSLTDLCSTFLYLNKILLLWTSTKLYGLLRDCVNRLWNRWIVCSTSIMLTTKM